MDASKSHRCTIICVKLITTTFIVKSVKLPVSIILLIMRICIGKCKEINAFMLDAKQLSVFRERSR